MKNDVRRVRQTFPRATSKKVITNVDNGTFGFVIVDAASGKPLCPVNYSREGAWAVVAQQLKNVPRKRVHWGSTPLGVCPRKDQGADDEPEVKYASGATSQVLAVAHHTENVTCPVCRDYLRKKFPGAKLFCSSTPEVNT